MKTTYFSFVLLMIFSVAFCQTKPTINNSNTYTSLLDTNQTDSIKVYTMLMLGKTAWEDHFNKDKINLTPKNFNWFSDKQRIESIKNMALNIRQQDFCGRDLPVDINTMLIQQVYSRSLLDR